MIAWCLINELAEISISDMFLEKYIPQIPLMIADKS